MSRENWYRNTSWSDAIEKEFFARLQRSRHNSSKVQYLRIQALYLHEAHPQVSNYLLDCLLALPTEQTEVASTYLQKAELAIVLGRPHEEIVSFFRKSIQQQREFPNVTTTVHLRFGRYVVDIACEALYDEVLQVLSEYADINRLPSVLYETNGIRSIIYKRKNQNEIAARFAREAIHQASRTESGFRRHRTLGLVKDRSSEFHKKIEKIATNSQQVFPEIPQRMSPK